MLTVLSLNSYHFTCFSLVSPFSGIFSASEIFDYICLTFLFNAKSVIFVSPIGIQLNSWLFFLCFPRKKGEQSSRCCMHHNVELCSINWCRTNTERRNANASGTGQSGGGSSSNNNGGRKETKKIRRKQCDSIRTFAEIFKKCLENGAKKRRIFIKINIFTVVPAARRICLCVYSLASILIPIFFLVVVVHSINLSCNVRVYCKFPGRRNSSTILFPLKPVICRRYFPYYVTFSRCSNDDIHCKQCSFMLFPFAIVMQPLLLILFCIDHPLCQINCYKNTVNLTN